MRPKPLPIFLNMLRNECGDDPAMVAAVLAGIRTYQRAPRPEPLHRDIVARSGRAQLFGFGDPGKTSGRPIVFVPSLINDAYILDLDSNRSLMRWLADRGLRPLLFDWGVPDADERDLDISGHVQQLLLPLLTGLGEPPLLVGYCLGGTMTIAAAALTPVAGLATIAAPWNFAGYPERSAGEMIDLWLNAQPAADAAGLLPIEVLQAGFWRLDPERTIAKYARLAEAAEDAGAVANFVGVEDWANSGPPLTLAAARQLFEAMIERDEPGRGEWKIGDRAIDPAALDIPILEVVSETDRIVPAATAHGIGERLSLGLGHVGMIVGGSARERLWEPLAAWLEAHC